MYILISRTVFPCCSKTETIERINVLETCSRMAQDMNKHGMEETQSSWWQHQVSYQHKWVDVAP